MCSDNLDTFANLKGIAGLGGKEKDQIDSSTTRHLSSRACMRADLDFGDLNRPGMYMTGFKERSQPESASAVSVEEMTYCRDDDSVGCDLELLERLQAGRGHSGGTSSAAFG